MQLACTYQPGIDRISEEGVLGLDLFSTIEAQWDWKKDFLIVLKARTEPALDSTSLECPEVKVLPELPRGLNDLEWGKSTINESNWTSKVTGITCAIPQKEPLAVQQKGKIDLETPLEVPAHLHQLPN